ncbi:MAG: hypothetical protein ACK4MF_00560 [Hyphomicrobiaceae bacterium]
MRMVLNSVATAVASVALALICGAVPALAQSKNFTFSESANARLAKKMNIPIYFALPSSARAPLAGPFKTTDVLVDFKHPDAIKSGSDAGLRLIVTKRSGMSARLAQSGLIQTGDILLTFRPEWGGAGAYPNVQMGISHTGVAFVKGGKVLHTDMPLNEEYHGPGMRADMTSNNYKTLSYLHVVRPRGLTDSDRANIAAWASRLNQNAKKIYPSQISFNDDYNAPKWKPGRTPEFVQQLARLALGQTIDTPLNMYCSEYAWSLLALRGCDPATTADQFAGKRMPSCVKQIMEPMEATGYAISRSSRSAEIGLVDGPLTVIDGLALPDSEKRTLLEAVFDENPDGVRKMSEGHRKVAADMQPKFARLKTYYTGMSVGGMMEKMRARAIRTTFNLLVPENYSPTSFLVNTLLPTDNTHRTMDYVATIVIE